LVRSAQAPWAKQAVVPIGQAVHWPETHVCPVRHSLPQAPQFLVSLDRSAQPLAQVTSPCGQVQMPFWQLAPGLHGPMPPQSHLPAVQVPPAQSTPQAPQFLVSVCVSMQAVPQTVPVQLPLLLEDDIVPEDDDVPPPEPLEDEEEEKRPPVPPPVLPQPAGTATIQAERSVTTAAANARPELACVGIVTGGARLRRERLSKTDAPAPDTRVRARTAAPPPSCDLAAVVRAW
jgi:hypothetical protein